MVAQFDRLRAARSDLVQHRPEQVVVAFVDQRHADVDSRQTAGTVQSGESAANNEYVRMLQSTHHSLIDS
jgi:hypothetical protein